PMLSGEAQFQPPADGIADLGAISNEVLAEGARRVPASQPEPSFRTSLGHLSDFCVPLKVLYNRLPLRGDCHAGTTLIPSPRVRPPRPCRWHVRRTRHWRCPR